MVFVTQMGEEKEFKEFKGQSRGPQGHTLVTVR